MRSTNLALKFFLEVAAFASFAVGGWHLGTGVLAAVLALLAPAAAITVWALFCAPRSVRRLPTTWRAPLELGIFLLAAAALSVSGYPVSAAIFAGAVAINALLLTGYRQWGG